MSERTHGDQNAIDDEIPIPTRPLEGPTGMQRDHNTVLLLFENPRYAQIFLERHEPVPRNALQAEWASYYDPRTITSVMKTELVRLAAAWAVIHAFSDENIRQIKQYGNAAPIADAVIAALAPFVTQATPPVIAEAGEREAQGWNHRYRPLAWGEVILPTDECRGDDGAWVTGICVGEKAPDPAYTSHRVYRRLISTPATLDNTAAIKTMRADDIRDAIRAWLDAEDATHWGAFEIALDAAVQGVNEREAAVAMLRADAETMRGNANAYSEEAPSDARALHEVATTLVFKAAQIERGDHLATLTAKTEKGS